MKKNFFLLIATALIVVVGSSYWAYSSGRRAGYEDRVKKEVEGQYRPAASNDPANLQVNVNEILKGLVQLGESQPNQEFQDSVNAVNRAVLNELVKHYALSDAEEKAVFKQYEKMSKDVVASYFKELQTLNKSRVSMPSQQFLTLKTCDVANDFSVLLADKSCALFSLVMGFSSMDTGSKMMLGGSCKFIAEQLLAPFVQTIKDKSLVIDLVKSQYEIKEHTRSAIAELAVAEDRLNEVLNRTFTRTFFKGGLFEFSSTAELSVQADGSIKAGFALQDAYDVRIDHDSKTIYVNLPEAKVLSKDIRFEILKDENGWFINMTTERRNQAFSEFREQMERAALERGLLKVAKGHAVKLVQMLYSPITYLPGSSYRVEVQFGQRQETAKDENKLRRISQPDRAQNSKPLRAVG